MTTLIQHLVTTSHRNSTAAKPKVREQIAAAVTAQQDEERDRRYQRMECQLDECDRVLKRLTPSQ